jgi:DHA1 family bicyclomycin/chloramphenicol resistance-like MFS transporter
MSVSFIGSSQLNSVLLKKFSSEQMIFTALILQSIISIVFLILSLNNWLNLYGTITMLFLFLGCLGISNPNTAGLTMAPFAKNAGSASALMGAIQLGLGALASFAVGIFVKNSIAPMVLIMTATTIIALIVLNIGKRFIKEKVELVSDEEIILGH